MDICLLVQYLIKTGAKINTLDLRVIKFSYYCGHTQVIDCLRQNGLNYHIAT